MKNLYLVLIIFLLLPLSGFSQGENDNWYFGNKAAVNFSLGTPISMGGSAMNAQSGVASVSDAAGNLLFYTDGLKVWNSNNQIMVNGGCCMTASSGALIPGGTQGVIIVPSPSQPNIYFIFTTFGEGVQQVNTSAAYSVVDMSLANGLGAVIAKNIPLKDALGSTTWSGGYTDNITVTKNNAGGYWVLIAHQNKLLAYKVDFSGVDTNPVVTTLNFYTNRQSQLKVSPNQAFLAISALHFIGTYDDVFIYYFNAVSGTVNPNPYVSFIGPDPGTYYATAFSSQSNILWVTELTHEDIYGYDLFNLSAPPVIFDIGPSQNPPLGDIQIGPDDEIYYAMINSVYLGKIINSNNLSTAAFNSHAVSLTGRICYEGLPQHVPSRPNCIQDLILSSNEQSDVIHKVSHKITTNLNYVACGVDVTLRAGSYVELLPNTFLCADLNYVLVEIGSCVNPPILKPTSSVLKNHQTKVIYLPNGDNPQIRDFEIFPNPVVDVLNITLPSSVELKSASMHDLLGKQTQVSVGENNTIDMSQMASGVYILKLETNQGTMTQKVIKN